LVLYILLDYLSHKSTTKNREVIEGQHIAHLAGRPSRLNKPYSVLTLIIHKPYQIINSTLWPTPHLGSKSTHTNTPNHFCPNLKKLSLSQLLRPITMTSWCLGTPLMVKFNRVTLHQPVRPR